MSVLQTVLSFILLISLSNTVSGDILPGRSPLPMPPLAAPVKVMEENLDNKDPSVVAKIIIPKSLLPDLQGSTSGSRAANGSSAATIIAGLALAAAAISLMFANRKSPHWKKAVICLFGCVVVGGIALLANSLLPPRINALTGDPSQPQQLILIEVQEFGHEVTLVLPSRK